MHTPTDQAFKDRLAANLAGFKRKIVVMSGKGGVGKSTVAASIATLLSQQGFKVGLLDVDLHGPTASGLFGLRGLRLTADGNLIHPYNYDENLSIISIQGLTNDPDAPLIWRGPMKIGVINQLLGDVSWGPLDFLVIDCPPGTGDEPLTIAQVIPDAEAVIVTTPQEVALADVRKSINFCHDLKLSVLGLVENMSGFVCPTCQTVHNIFSTGGGEALASQYAVPFLGRVPIDPSVVNAGDGAMPLPPKESPAYQALTDIIAKIAVGKPKEEAKSMKIAVPVVNGKLCQHFGHCEQFALVETNNNTILATELVTPPPHEPGLLPRWLGEKNVGLVIAGGMGVRAQELFTAAGVEVVTGAPSIAPEEVVRQFLDDVLIVGINGCTHEDGHECNH